MENSVNESQYQAASEECKRLVEQANGTGAALLRALQKVGKHVPWVGERLCVPLLTPLKVLQAYVEYQKAHPKSVSDPFLPHDLETALNAACATAAGLRRDWLRNFDFAFNYEQARFNFGRLTSLTYAIQQVFYAFTERRLWTTQGAVIGYLRGQAKRITFGRMYGMDADRIADVILGFGPMRNVPPSPSQTSGPETV